MIPTIVTARGPPRTFKLIERPTTDASPPNARRQNPWLRMAAPCVPASSGRNARPCNGCTPNVAKKSDVTRPALTARGPSSVSQASVDGPHAAICSKAREVSRSRLKVSKVTVVPPNE
jgi:hypothetical protein